jgi:flagellar biosynthetic protein FliP
MKGLIFILLLFSFDEAIATDLTVNLTDKGLSSSGGFSARIIQILGLMTILSVAPSLVMLFTSFTKIVVVLSILKNALGLQQTPPNTVLAGLALFLTLFIMQAPLQTIYDEALEPLMEERITNEMAWEAVQKPVKGFLLTNVAEKELSLFRAMATIPQETKNEEVSFQVLVPAFLISELRKAFEIGFLIFLPFLIIDLVIAAVLMSMGMMMLPPAMISLPFKLIFFVLADGWYMICGSLVKSYGL